MIRVFYSIIFNICYQDKYILNNFYNLILEKLKLNQK